MAPVRTELLVAGIVASGCSRSAAGPWTDPGPITPGALSIAYFESDVAGTNCLWWQLDPIGGGRRELLRIPGMCMEPTATWSPDGSRVAIMNDATQPLYEVALASGKWRPLPRPPGEIERLFYRDGELQAW